MALMPTASSAQIIGQNESFECMTYNVYARRVLSGDFKLVNSYMQRDLWERGLWTEDMQRKIVTHRGSIQDISDIPDDLKALYKTAFEIKQRAQLDLAIERSPFIDQTQSLNIFVTNPTDNILTTIQMYAWKNRLKTGQYYLRRESTTKAVAFTSTPKATTAKPQPKKKDDQPKKEDDKDEPKLCLLSDPDCAACQV
jgi:ribonucleotide reductase alpha subunit